MRFLDERSWETTDLFLDLWLGRDGVPRLLDEDELREAEARGWIDAAAATAARNEAQRLLREAAAGHWPPAVVREWTLERVRRTLAEREGGGTRQRDAG